MLIFNENKLISGGLLLVVAWLMAGCVNLHDFTMGDSHRQLNDVQILDPSAAERNEGIVLTLDGKYARATMQAYKKSNSEPKVARGKVSSATSGK